MADRQAFIDAALNVVGLGANPKNTETRQKYTELIAPGESDLKIHDMLAMSGCGLVVAGIWRMAGVKDKRLEPPYIISTAVSRLILIAHQHDAWVNFRPNASPKPGDMVLIGDDGAGGVTHVYTVVLTSLDGYHLESVDGGQRDDNGYETILHKNRIWKGQRDIAYMGNDPGNNQLGGRKIYGWVDVESLPTT